MTTGQPLFKDDKAKGMVIIHRKEGGGLANGKRGLLEGSNFTPFQEVGGGGL